MSLPHFIGHDGVCPLLENVIGNMEGGRRWAAFLAFGSRTSLEFQNSWSSLSREAAHYAGYLDVALESPLSNQVESAVQGDGSTRRKLVGTVPSGS